MKINDLNRTSSAILNRYGKRRQPCFVPDFSGIALSFSPFNLMLAIGLLKVAFNMCRCVPYVPDLFNTFMIKECWIVSKASFFMRWPCFLFFIYVEPLLYLLGEAYLIMVDNLFNVFLDSFSSILLSFASMFIKEIDP